MNEVIQKTIQIEENKEYVFRNQVDFCIGTGRMGLALTKEYQEQLSLVQKEIGFSHIRGHGMSSENYVGIIMAENLRFLGEGSSAQGTQSSSVMISGGIIRII